MGWNVINVNEKNADKALELINKMYQKRKDLVAAFLSEHKDEVDNLPQVLKVRMAALKEVNPKRFNDSPELPLSTLAAVELIKKFPDGPDGVTAEDVDNAHKKYNLERGDDVGPFLVTHIYLSYLEDVKSGAISRDGKIIDIEKSQVMQTHHDSKSYGLPNEAKEIMAKFKKTTNIHKNTRGIEME